MSYETWNTINTILDIEDDLILSGCTETKE